MEQASSVCHQSEKLDFKTLTAYFSVGIYVSFNLSNSQINCSLNYDRLLSSDSAKLEVLMWSITFVSYTIQHGYEIKIWICVLKIYTDAEKQDITVEEIWFTNNRVAQ